MHPSLYDILSIRSKSPCFRKGFLIAMCFRCSYRSVLLFPLVRFCDRNLLPAGEIHDQCPDAKVATYLTMVIGFITVNGSVPFFFQTIMLEYNTRLYNRESLIIFDEVQKFPRAREAIKYLVADGGGTVVRIVVPELQTPQQSGHPIS